MEANNLYNSCRLEQKGVSNMSAIRGKMVTIFSVAQSIEHDIDDYERDFFERQSEKNKKEYEDGLKAIEDEAKQKYQQKNQYLKNTCDKVIEELQRVNGLLTKTESEERIHQVNQKLKIEKLRKKNEMPSVTVDENIDENLRLYTKMQTMIKDKERFDSKLRRIETHTRDKYEEELNKMKQQMTMMTDKYKSKIERTVHENFRLRKKLNILKTSFEKNKKEQEEALKAMEDEAKQKYQKQIQDWKNKCDEMTEELQRENKRLTKKESEERPYFELQMYKSKIEKLEKSMVNDNTRRQEDERNRIHQVNLKLEIEKLRKENKMLNVTVDEKIAENLRLDTKMQTMIKDKKRKTLQTIIDDLRKELMDKQSKINEAQEVLSRSESLSYLEEDRKIRSSMVNNVRKETTKQHHKIYKDQTETLYECKETSLSLQSSTQKPSDDNVISLAMGSETTATVLNTYNIINSSVNFQRDCMVKTNTNSTSSSPSFSND